jgi:TolB-like protein/tetratricopeptide (TPR) repeat protein
MTNPSPGSTQGPTDQPPEAHLDSWKEIATYLKRDVKTVQRWEKREGMPIHRHVHDKGGSVYAFSSELDAWLQSRSLRLEEEEEEPRLETPVDAEGDRGPRGTPGTRRWLVLGGVAVLALLAGTYVMTRSRARAATRSEIRSLAVLPLKNLSGNPGQQYFVDGLTEELTADLARLGNLRVISRTSAMLYTDTLKPLPQIARELNVDAVVTGTVQRSGNRVRVRTKLVRAATDEVLWAESYDRDSDDVLRLGGEVSQAIAHEVGIKLTPQVQHRLEHKSTTNPEARDAYLRARYFFDKDDKEGATKCLQYFQEAIAKDPSYAAAYAGLSRCIDLGTFFNAMSEPEAAPKIKAAAMKAVELDDGLGEGHSELGDYYLERAWDFSAAAHEYKRAIELDPNSSVAHAGYAYYFRDLGQTDKALQEMQRARELDPLSLKVANDFAWFFLNSRRYDEAVNQLRKVLEMDPNYRRARWGLARAYELKGMYKEAISECLKIPALPNIDPFAKALFKNRCSLYQKAYPTSGGEHINRRWFESARQEIKNAINRDDDAYSIATLYAASGEQGKALDLLERGYAQHDRKLLQLKVDPRLDNLRSSPRFQALLRRMNFPE